MAEWMVGQWECSMAAKKGWMMGGMTAECSVVQMVRRSVGLKACPKAVLLESSMVPTKAVRMVAYLD